jgi:hypothetical protein
LLDSSVLGFGPTVVHKLTPFYHETYLTQISNSLQIKTGNLTNINLQPHYFKKNSCIQTSKILI